MEKPRPPRSAIVTATPRSLTREDADEAERLQRELLGYGQRLQELDRRVQLPQSAAAIAALRIAWGQMTLLADQLGIAAGEGP